MKDFLRDTLGSLKRAWDREAPVRHVATVAQRQLAKRERTEQRQALERLARLLEESWDQGERVSFLATCEEVESSGDTGILALTNRRLGYVTTSGTLLTDASVEGISRIRLNQSIWNSGVEVRFDSRTTHFRRISYRSVKRLAAALRDTTELQLVIDAKAWEQSRAVWLAGLVAVGLSIALVASIDRTNPAASTDRRFETPTQSAESSREGANVPKPHKKDRRKAGDDSHNRGKNGAGGAIGETSIAKEDRSSGESSSGSSTGRSGGGVVDLKGYMDQNFGALGASWYKNITGYDVGFGSITVRTNIYDDADAKGPSQAICNAVMFWSDWKGEIIWVEGQGGSLLRECP